MISPELREAFEERFISMVYNHGKEVAIPIPKLLSFIAEREVSAERCAIERMIDHVGKKSAESSKRLKDIAVELGLLTQNNKDEV